MKWWIETLLRPLGERVGTALAVLIVAGGDKVCEVTGACGLVSPDGATAVATWCVAAAFLLLDVLLARMERKRIVQKARNDIFSPKGP